MNNPGLQHPDTPLIQRLILDAILTYTQPTLTSDQSEEGNVDLCKEKSIYLPLNEVNEKLIYLQMH